MKIKNDYLKNKYNITLNENLNLKEQIIHSKDGYAKIYSIFRQVDSLNTELIYTSSVDAIESIMGDCNVAIYTVNYPYLRLKSLLYT